MPPGLERNAGICRWLSDTEIGFVISADKLIWRLGSREFYSQQLNLVIKSLSAAKSGPDPHPKKIKSVKELLLSALSRIINFKNRFIWKYTIILENTRAPRNLRNTSRNS
jgi:hypothetical protein